MKNEDIIDLLEVYFKRMIYEHQKFLGEIEKVKKRK